MRRVFGDGCGERAILAGWRSLPGIAAAMVRSARVDSISGVLTHQIIASVLTAPLEVAGVVAVSVMMGSGIAGSIALLSGEEEQIGPASGKGAIIGFIFGLPLALGLGLYLLFA